MGGIAYRFWQRSLRFFFAWRLPAILPMRNTLE